MTLRLLVLVSVLTAPLVAADAPPAADALRNVQAEVERRRELRIKAEVAEAAREAKARQTIHDAETHIRVVPPEEMAAARDVIAHAALRRKPSAPAPNPNKRVSMVMADADMPTWAAAWKIYFGQIVTITDRVRKKSASIRIVPALPLGEVKPKMLAALQRAGVYVIETPNEVFFDTEPAPLSTDQR